MALRLRPPMRKRHAPPGKPQPFPVPLASFTGLPASNINWSFYEGELQGNTIVIKNPKDADEIHRKGCFGRWSTSRKQTRKNEKVSPYFSNISCANDKTENVATPHEEEQKRIAIGDKNNASCNNDDDEIIILNNSSSDEVEEPVIINPSTSSYSEVLSFEVKQLYLSLEEGFFLLYGLGCLIISNSQKKLTIDELWQICCENQPSFPFSYVAYHHYRSKGWVIQHELKYGSDFLLYKYGPQYYHSSYSVVLQTAANLENSSATFRQLSWTTLAGLNRITEHVAKEVILCYVLPSDNLIPLTLNCPSCISKFKIQEILVRRWISAQERESQDVIS